jgi:hypothetical protein
VTTEEFEEQYAARCRNVGFAEVTVQWLHENGRYGAPCDCGWEDCEGFQMAYQDDQSIAHLNPTVAKGEFT